MFGKLAVSAKYALRPISFKMLPKIYFCTKIPPKYHRAEITNFNSDRHIRIVERDFREYNRKLNRNSVVLKMITSSLNPLDVMVKNGKGWRIFTTGKKVQFPLVRGLDGYGTILKTGENVLNFKKGDKVVFTNLPMKEDGSHVSYLTVRKTLIKKAPKNASPEMCGAFPFVSCCALSAASWIKSSVESKSRVLVLGGGGSVGSVLIQVLKNRGILVDSISGPKDLEFCKTIGAVNSFDYKDPEILDKIKNGSVKYDHLIDTSKYGSTDISRYYPFIQKGGYVLSLNNDYFKTIDQKEFLMGTLCYCAHYVKKIWSISQNFGLKYRILFYSPIDPGRLEEVIELIDQGKLRLKIDKSFALKDLVKAYARAESRECDGKVVIRNQEVE